MASYQFLPYRPVGSFVGRVRARDPLWYRVGEVVVASTIIGSNLFWDAVEDAAARVWRSLTRH